MLLDNICKSYGVRLLTYQNSKDVIQRKLKMKELAARSSGLAAYAGDTPVIFFDDTRPPVEVDFTIAHELGHIMLGHLSFRRDFGWGMPDSAEREADAFAVQLLANELRRRYEVPT